MFNKVILIGRLVADPQLRYTGSNIPVASFRIAVDRPRNSSSQAEKVADFIDIVAWRQRGEFVSKYFNKGKLILVEGSLQMRKWQDKDGNNRISAEVVADNLQFVESKRAGEEYGGAPVSAPSSAPANLGGEPAFGSQNVDFAEISADDDLPF